MDDIEHAIRTLLDEYIANPLRHIREIGQQVRMHSLLSEPFSGNCTACVLDRSGAQTQPGRAGQVQRVQCEVKIEMPDGDCSKRSDLVIFKSDSSPVCLTRWPNGAYDIVACVPIDHIDAAIEIKAACSADASQRHLFRMDVEKLWLIASASQRSVAAHFVLIDKSIPMNGFEAPLPAAAHIGDWHTENVATVEMWTQRAKEKFWNLSPKFAPVSDTSTGFGFVNVWDLVLDESSLPVIRHRRFRPSETTPQRV